MKYLLQQKFTSVTLILYLWNIQESEKVKIFSYNFNLLRQKKLHVSVDSYLSYVFFFKLCISFEILSVYFLFTPPVKICWPLCSMAYIKTTTGMLNMFFLNYTKSFMIPTKISRGHWTHIPFIQFVNYSFNSIWKFVDSQRTFEYNFSKYGVFICIQTMNEYIKLSVVNLGQVIY